MPCRTIRKRGTDQKRKLCKKVIRRSKDPSKKGKGKIRLT